MPNDGVYNALLLQNIHADIVRLPIWKMIGARAETAHEGPIFKNTLAHRRSLVAANGPYEWKRVKDRSR